MDRKMLPTFTFVLAVAVGLAVGPTTPVPSPDSGASTGQRVTIDPDGRV
jgi:hypothetical protein